MQDSFHHEILLALSGYPGNTFRVSKETGNIEVDPNLPLIHPSEASLLNRICKLGTHYSRVKKFISDQNAVIFSLPPLLPPPPNAPRSGLYLKALSSALDSILSDYRQRLIDLEQKCMKEPHLPLSYLQSRLEDFQLLLPALEGCVRHVTTSGQCQGPQILSYVHDQCDSGVPIIHTYFKKILCVCHGVLYKQLSAWMLHGLLLDEKGEFFIGLRQKKPPPGSSDGGQPPHQLSAAARGQEFVIHHALAPSYLPARVLEKILFVGEAVTIFQTKTGVGKSGAAMATNLSNTGSKFRSEQFRFGHMLTQLQRQPVFQLHEFEMVIDSIRDCVAELLWSLLVEESDLTGHLQLMKDFFLLGRGELFLAFVDLAQHFMSIPPSATTQHDVNVAFHQAMVRVGMDSESMAKQFQLLVPFVKQRGAQKTSSASSESPKWSGWHQLTLSHTLEWPLPILFTPPVLEKYNALFHVLLGLRRTQMWLDQSWALLLQHRSRYESLRSVWELRTHMAFLINNLQYYVQVDVLETQFSQLLDKVGSTHDYETIKHAHEKYLTTLQSQLFLTQPSISRCLQEMMKLCNAFSSLLQSCPELLLRAREQEEVARIAKDFSKQSSLFFDIVSGIKVHGCAPHLAQLLLRVDYNKYFSSNTKYTRTHSSSTY